MITSRGAPAPLFIISHQTGTQARPQKNFEPYISDNYDKLKSIGYSLMMISGL